MYSLAGDNLSIWHPNGSVSAVTLHVCDELPTVALARYCAISGFPSGGTILTNRLVVVTFKEEISFGTKIKNVEKDTD